MKVRKPFAQHIVYQSYQSVEIAFLVFVDAAKMETRTKSIKSNDNDNTDSH